MKSLGMRSYFDISDTAATLDASVPHQNEVRSWAPHEAGSASSWPAHDRELGAATWRSRHCSGHGHLTCWQIQWRQWTETACACGHSDQHCHSAQLPGSWEASKARAHVCWSGRTRGAQSERGSSDGRERREVAPEYWPSSSGPGRAETRPAASGWRRTDARTARTAS